MSGGLVLRLRPKEKFLINGVVMENGDKRASLCVKSQNANILRFRDAMHPDDANTPAKRLYYIAQLVVAGEADPEEGKEQLLHGLNDLQNAFGDCPCISEFEAAHEHIHAGRFYHVMRTMNRIIPHEALLLTVSDITQSKNKVEAG